MSDTSKVVNNEEVLEGVKMQVIDEPSIKERFEAWAEVHPKKAKFLKKTGKLVGVGCVLLAGYLIGGAVEHSKWTPNNPETDGQIEDKGEAASVETDGATEGGVVTVDF